MAITIYDTLTMLEAVKTSKPVPSFLRDNYFPTAPADIFTTEKVIVDFENEATNKLAPAVIKGSVPVQRNGFESHDYTPPLLAPSMPLTIEQLNTRSFGESIVSGMTAEQREAQYLADDLRKLEGMISRTEEVLASSILSSNAFTINQYLNGYGTALTQPFAITYYGDGNLTNQAVYTPDDDWDTSSTAILSDIAAMCQMLKKKGYPATDVIMGAAAADVFMHNTEIRTVLDNRRLQLVADTVSPEDIGAGVTYLGRFNASGNIVDIYSYTATYDNNGTETYIFPENKIVVTAKGMGRTAYGAVTQYEENAVEATTYASKRVPHVLINRHDGIRELRLQARPLPMPKRLNAAISATVITD